MRAKILAGMLTLMILAVGRPAAGSSTWTVTNTGDSSSTAGTLRWAITNAQPGDTVQFNLACPSSITVGSNLDISKNLTITGPGASCLTIHGTNSSRVFLIEAGVTASISGLTIANGRDAIQGGGLYNQGTLTLSDSVVTQNFVPFNSGNAAGGGGIANSGTLTVSNCTISSNSTNATSGGGGIRNSSTGTLTLENSLISGNTSGNDGGGIWNKGSMAITDSTITNNSTSCPSAAGSCNGGGIWTGSGNNAGQMVTVTGSTFARNSAAYGVSTSLNPEGGAVYFFGSGQGGNNSIVNSTFSGNKAKVYGGAISDYDILSVSYSTFAGDMIQNGHGDEIAINASTSSGHTLTLKGSILAGGAGGSCYVGGTGLASDGYNLSTDGACASFLSQASDLNSTPAGLDPSGLQNNGGPTETIALLSSSKAVDAGSSGACTDAAGNTVAVDQRGETRPQGSGCDIGAFELEVTSATTVTNTNDSGAGSLRDAIANATDGGTIDFNLTYPATITLTSGALRVEQNLTIRGPGADQLAISGNYSQTSSGSQIVFVALGYTVSISGVTLENGDDANGGAVMNAGTLHLSDCVLSGNQSLQGGALNNQGTGTLTVTNCTVTGNSASVLGAGLVNFGTATITSSTFDANTAVEAGGAFNGGTLTIVNSTFANNQGSSFEGAIGNDSTLHVSNSTFYNNSAGTSSIPGGIYNFSGGAATLKGTLLAKGGMGGNCGTSGGTFVSQGFNLSDDGSCNSFLSDATDLNSTAAGLDPNGLQDNGGPTKTVALISGAAIDAIPSGSCSDVDGNALATDQRGVTRPQGNGCDIGAFEAVTVATTTTISVSPSTISFGGSTTATATVTSTAGTPTGTVNVSDASGASCVVTLSGGTGTCLLTPLAAEPSGENVSGAYPGSGIFMASNSAAVNLTVNKATTSTVAISSLNPSIYGEPMHFTATVSSTAGTPTGTVTFYDGSILNLPPLYSSTLDSNGQADFTPVALSAGAHTIIVSYGGDANFDGSQSAGLGQTVNKASTTTAVTANPNPASTAQSINFSVTVQSQFGLPQGGGMISSSGATNCITLMEGATKILATGPVQGGTAGGANFSISLGQGTHTVTAVYCGDGNNTGSTSPSITVVVNAPQATTTSLVTSLNPSFVGQAVTFTATVTPSAATGTVTFMQGQTVLGSNILASGQAAITASALPAGNFTIVAVYSGDGQYAGSTSLGLAQTVSKASTSISLVSSPDPSVVNQNVTFTAHVTVTSAHGPAAPSGSVAFVRGSTVVGTMPLDSATGTAQFTYRFTTTGNFNIKAVYSGSAAYLGSTSAARTQVVEIIILP